MTKRESTWKSHIRVHVATVRPAMDLGPLDPAYPALTLVPILPNADQPGTISGDTILCS